MSRHVRRPLYAVAASVLLASCSHGAATIPATTPQSPQAPLAPSASATAVPLSFPLRAAAAARRAARSVSSSPAHCGTVVTQSFGTLTYAARGGHVANAKIDATGCDVGIFIGAGDGENDDGARIEHVKVSNAGFAGVLVTDGADDVRIDDAAIDGTGGGASDVSAGVAIDGATGVRVHDTVVTRYAAYGVLAEAGATFAFENVAAIGPGAVTTGAQAGFLVAGATQLGNEHALSADNRGTGATPAFLVPSGATGAQSWGYYYCAVTDKHGKPLTEIGDDALALRDTNATFVGATCPAFGPTASPTPAPTPTPTPTPVPTATPSPAPTGATRLYVASNAANTVNVFDASNGYAYLSTISDPSLNSPQVLLVDSGRLYVGNNGSNVSVFNTANNAFVTSITGYGLSNVFGLAAASGKLYAGANIGHVVVFDTTNNYALLPQISEPNEHGTEGVAYGNGKLYVVNTANQTGGPPLVNDIDVFDTANGNALVAQIPGPGTGSQAGMTAAAFANGLLYVTDLYANCVYVFDTANGNALVRTIADPTLSGPTGVAFAGGKLFVANHGSNTVSVFDAASNYALVTTVLSNGATAVAVQ